MLTRPPTTTRSDATGIDPLLQGINVRNAHAATVIFEGMVSVGGNLYSVPDGTRSRALEVYALASEVRIFEEGRLIATHPVLEGRHQRSVLSGHRRLPRAVLAAGHAPQQERRPQRAGQHVAQRPLTVYAALAKILAQARGLA